MMTIKKSAVATLIVLMILGVSSCYYDKADLLYGSNNPSDCTTAKYSTVIHPIITSKCATSGCHYAGNTSPELGTHALDSASSVRINVRACVQKTMPPSNPLSASEVASLQCWINAGAPNN
jgi:hypothetical protein